MKKIILTLALLTTATTFAEQYTANQGLEKIKTNFDNSKLNKNEYEKNLGTVTTNLNELSKAKSSVVNQKSAVSQEILSNNESMKKILIQEKEIQAAIKEEQTKMQVEKQQIENLEKVIAQIKQNQIKREEIIAGYEAQLKSNSDEKLVWKNRETELRNQEAETIKALRGIASEETTWQNKKKGYELEVKRWSAETEKQQKIYDTYQGLKNGQ